MPILRVNADHDRPLPENPLEFSRLASPSQGGPVIVMVHGFRHSPFDQNHDPHTHILALDPTQTGRSLSWPHHLGFGRGNPAEGLAVAFGWDARGSIWRAYRSAGAAGRALSHTISELSRRTGRPVSILAHSLGARVALEAIGRLDPGAVANAILIAGAEFSDRAEDALSSPGGQEVQVLNVVSRENVVFDLAFERVLQPPWGARRALSARTGQPGWHNLVIDCAVTRAHLTDLGFPLRGRSRAVCHWSGYMRPGLFPIYDAVLRGVVRADRLVPDQPLRALSITTMRTAEAA